MDELDDDRTSNLEGADASVDQWREGSDALVVRVTGEVDMSNAATVQEVIDQVTGAGVEHLIFDLGGPRVHRQLRAGGPTVRRSKSSVGTVTQPFAYRSSGRGGHRALRDVTDGTMRDAAPGRPCRRD